MTETAIGRHDSLLSALLLTLSALSLGRALQINHGMFHPQALPWLSVALALAAIATATSGNRRTRIGMLHGRTLLAAVLVIGLWLQLAQLALAQPALRVFPGGLPLAFRMALVTVGLLSLLGVAGVRITRRLWFPSILVIHAAIGYWVLQASPQSPVDVFLFQRDASAALLDGHNPYTLRYPNIYGPDTPFYGQGLSVDGWLTFGFPYFPLSLLLVLPGHLIAGDFRYAHLVALTLAGAFIGYSRRGPLAAAAACLLLFTPRVFLILEIGWTEPVAVLLLAATIFCACRMPKTMPYAFGLLLAVKQYMVFVLPIAYLLARATNRHVTRVLMSGIIVAAAVTLPFFVWEPRAFVESAVTLQLRQPFRPDALSYPAWLFAYTGVVLPGAVAFFVAAVTVPYVLRLSPRTPSGAARAIAVIYFVFFAFNKQAFANYYLFVIAALCCAIATAVDDDRVRDEANPHFERDPPT